MLRAELLLLLVASSSAFAQDERPAAQIGVVRDIRPLVAPRRLPHARGVVRDGDALVWTAEVADDAATGLRLHFARCSLPEGAELRVVDPEASQVLGPWTDDAGAFWTPTVFGGRARVELRVPRAAAGDAVDLAIDRVARRTAPVHAPQEKASSACYKDVACDPSYDADVSRAVAVIDFVEGGSEFLCSGALLDDAAHSGAPWFLTAHHCVSTQAAASSCTFYFDYKAKTCGGLAPALTSVPRASGATLVATSADSDVTLLRIAGALPSNRFFCAWTSDPQPTGENVVGVHHPGGTRMRISYGTLQDPQGDFHAVQWYDGVTAEGSSGSPLFNPAKQIIGQLYGGSSYCEFQQGIDVYGRFDRSYPLLAPFIDVPRAAPPGDAWDPADDAPAGATVLVPAFPTQVHGPHTLSATDAVDWFAFDLTAGTRYRFFSLGTDDVSATLYSDEGATAVASDDDGAGSSQFSIDYVATTTARHWLAVRGGAATYRLAYEAVDPSQRRRPAAPADLRKRVAGTLVKLTWADRARNETGYYVERSDDGGADWTRVAELPRNAKSHSDSATPGVWRYRVGAWNAAGVAWKTIGVTVRDANARDSADPLDDHAADAPTLPAANGAQAHGFSRADFADWFRFAAEAGRVYEFSTSGRMDTTGAVFADAAADPLVEDDDSGPAKNFSLRFTAPASGVYFLRVAPFEPGMTGSYVLTWRTR